jgi:ABC-type lipoprotein export system ATPase subunit
MTESVVELRDVFCVHRTNEGDAAALQGAHLDVAEHEVLCVLGPSGAGKSTLLRVIAGVQTPSAGLVSVFGQDVGRMAPRARARFRHQLLGFLGQHAESALPPDLPARDVVALPLALRGVPGRARRARAAELLGAVDLGACAGALPGELSGGERQRLALCAAVAHRPSLLLADEPTGELDEVNAVAVRALIVTLARTDGATVIIVSHDAGTAEIADRVVAIRDGRAVEDHRQGESALVVGRDGWLRLPSGLLTQAGISGRARVGRAPGGLLITPAATPRATAVTTPAPVAPTESAEQMPITRWPPARVELRSVTRSYGQGHRRRRVIDELTRIFQPGCLTVVTGPSGTGKTTLLRLLAGLDRPDSGLLTIDDDQLSERDDEQLATLRRRRIGYLPQEPAPVGFLSARENVVLALRVRDCDAHSAEERATAALARVDLTERAGQRVHRLSAGETQRVALARALASARGLLIVDEPTSRLDERNAGIVAGLLAAAAREDGQTVICATHDPAVIGRAEQLLTLPG